MSLDLGGGVSDQVHSQAAAVEEEDYCQFAAQRFQAQWAQVGVFSPAALRHFGVCGEYSLLRSLNQRRSFSAGFGLFPLGRLAPPVQTPFQPHHVRQRTNMDASAAQAVEGEATSHSTGSSDTIPFEALAFGQDADRRPIEPESNRTRENVFKFFGALQSPAMWSQDMCGVVTVPDWYGETARAEIEQQLQLASFLGVQAVLVPLPCVPELQLPTVHGSSPCGAAAAPSSASACVTSLEQQQTVLLCQAADCLRGFLQGGSGQKIWVSCDACVPAHRRWFQILLRALCYGYDVNEVTGAYTVRAPTVDTAMQQVRSETLMSLSVHLYFGDPESLLLANGQRLSASWLGEDVVAFDSPPAVLLREHLLQTSSVPAHEEDGGTVSPAGAPADDAAELSEDQQSEPAHAWSDSADRSFVLGSWGSGSHASYRASPQGSEVAIASPPTPSSSLSTSPTSEKSQLTAARAARRAFRVPDDVMSSAHSRWGGDHDVHTRLGLLAFLVELLRRRAAPVFREFFFDHYALLNYLYFKTAVDPPRDMFLRFEDSIQLPLQPLGNQLPSGVYEVFERDSSKYSAYRQAIYAYICDWLNAGPARWHALANRTVAERAMSPTGPTGTEEPTLYVVLLGCGRGPLIDECLSAASSLGVRVRLFAIEKNSPAATFTRLRATIDPEWAHLIATFGHSIDVITANGRTLFDDRAALSLPADFGLCDLLVSELLGSFGDNELSPECVEGFHHQLCQLQVERGITANAHLVSIPQSYTAWIAPLHSVRFEQAVAEASIKGFTVRPENCADPHAALYHAYYVSNVTRGALLAKPQRCWTFEHRWDTPTATSAGQNEQDALPPAAFERSATLRFAVSPQARCSALAGFFTAVLYAPGQMSSTAEGVGAVVELSTVGEARTKDMYSWFPCVFALEPSQAKELSPVTLSEANIANSKSASVTIQVRMHRRREQHRAWYTWQLAYSDHPSAFASSPVMNEDGWASTILV